MTTVKTNVEYNVIVSKKTLDHLLTLSEMGKNAQVLFQIGSAMAKNKPLPEWAKVTFDQSHFEKIMSLSNQVLSKICKTDSYAVIRQVVNCYLDGKLLSDKQLEKFEKVMTVTNFQNNEMLLKIKEHFKTASAQKSDAPLADNKTAKALSKVTIEQAQPQPQPQPQPQAEPQVQEIDDKLFSLADHVASLNLEDALKLQALINERIASLQQAEKIPA